MPELAEVALDLEHVGIRLAQLAQGLRPDGIAGPTTFMQLNRATGVDEPRLLTHAVN